MIFAEGNVPLLPSCSGEGADPPAGVRKRERQREKERKRKVTAMDKPTLHAVCSFTYRQER